MRIHRVYCKSVSGPNTKFALDNIQSHHLIKALRLKEGRVVEVFDGNGSSASCEIVLLNNNKCELERISDVNKDYEPHRTLTNIIPFIKTNNFNYMIQKLSEIGVNKFIIYKPELCDQSIAKKDLEKIIQKSKDIIINVCKQCGNNFLPQIIHTRNLDEAINLIEDDNNKYDLIIVGTPPDTHYEIVKNIIKQKPNAANVILGSGIFFIKTPAIIAPHKEPKL